MTQLGFYFDSSRCTGCKTCELACKDYKDHDVDMLFRKIYDYEGGGWVAGEETGTWITTTFAYHVSEACNHCAVPACFSVCPVQAISKDDDTGLVLIDEELCIGCGSCEVACPYDAPKMDAGSSKAKKCDGCYDRVKDDQQPICVEACPLRALEFDEIDKLKSAYGDLSQIPPLPDSSQTQPSVVIKPCPAIDSAELTKGMIVNELEVV